MMRAEHKAAGTVGILLLTAALSSCSSTPQWSELTTETATEKDSFPPAVADSSSVSQIDPDSVRLQWSSDDVAYYSALSTDDADSACLVVVAEDEAVTACGRQAPLTYEDEHGTVALGSTAPSNDWEQLSPVLWREA